VVLIIFDTAWSSGSTQQRRVERLEGGTEAVVRWRAVVAGGQVAAVKEQLHPNMESFIFFDRS
jgi:hypothetical protein